MLAANPALAGLTQLFLHPHLSEQGPFITLAELQALVRSPHLRSLTHLQVRLCDALLSVDAVDSDAANVFIALTARAINPDLRIVARASEKASIDKLVRAGADEVVSPNRLIYTKDDRCADGVFAQDWQGPSSPHLLAALQELQRASSGQDL